LAQFISAALVSHIFGTGLEAADVSTESSAARESVEFSSSDWRSC